MANKLRFLGLHVAIGLASLCSVAYSQERAKGLPDERFDLGPVKVRTLPASIEQILKVADRSLVGVVKDVQINREKIDGVDYPVPIKTVVFEVQQVLFDQTKKIKESTPYTVSCTLKAAFLSNEGRSSSGTCPGTQRTAWTSPVGIDSGYFRFTKDGKAVINLKGTKTTS